MKYRHLFFDLDGTLWDLHRNTRVALKIISDANPDLFSGVDFEQFYSWYHIRNSEVWTRYRHGTIAKEELRVVRFELALNDCGVVAENSAISNLADAFLEICPRQPHLVEGAQELLDHVSGRYHLHIITNGFQEVQGFKLAAAGITGYFSHIVFSEAAGVRKPNRGIFDLAFSLTGASPENSLMIGDDWEADIEGARSVGMDQAFLTTTELHNIPGAPLNDLPSKDQCTYWCESLVELIAVL